MQPRRAHGPAEAGPAPGEAGPAPGEAGPAPGEAEGPAEPRVSTGRIAGVLVAGDLLAVGIVVALASGAWPALLAYALAAVVWHRWSLFSRRFTLSFLDDLPVLLLGALGGVTVEQLVLGDLARPAAAALVAALLLGRAVTYGLVRGLRRRGWLRLRTVLVASRRLGPAVERRAREHGETGIDVVAVVESSSLPERADLPAGRALRDAVEGVLRVTRPACLLVADPTLAPDVRAGVVRAGQRGGTPTAVVSELLELHPRAADGDTIWGMPVEHMGPHALVLPARAAKRCLDVAFSGTALLLLAPAMALVALAVRLDLGPGVLFRQERVGAFGRPFTMLKFRSLPAEGPQEHGWGAAAGIPTSRVGSLIRRYSLDEMPQLFNVLRGDMSLVGPRPEQARFVDELCAGVAGYGLRHRTPVGLTGLAAVEGLRGNTSLADRVYFDNLYIETWSLWLDLKILGRTVGSVLRGSGG